MSSGPLRVAVVGYGLGGSVFHAPLVEATDDMTLEVVVTSDRERAEAARRRYPRARVVGRAAELFEDPDRVDLVVITVPNAHHFELAEAALEAGMATVIDKPVTPTSAEARRLARLAEEKGLSAIPYHNRRWDGDYLTLEGLVRSGRLGEVWRFESRFERWRPGPPPVRTWKHDASQPGGGILFDLGSHLVDQALHLFGRPQSVYAEMTGHGGPLDDDSFVALHYSSGPAVHLWAATTAASPGPRFRVLGSEAAYVKWGTDPQEAALRSGGLPSDPGWGSEVPEAWGEIGTVEQSERVPTRPGTYQQFYRRVADHMLRGAEPPVRMADAVAGLEILEAAIASARSGSVVTLH